MAQEYLRFGLRDFIRQSSMKFLSTWLRNYGRDAARLTTTDGFLNEVPEHMAQEFMVSY